MPERSCVGCRQVLDTGSLVRVRVGSDGLTVEPGPGRGAWVGPSPDCVALAGERRAFGRSLRVEVNADWVARLLDRWPIQPPACPHGGC
ncbi:MAG: YlxR family protein [Acidimicrobiales bacterium]